MENYISSNKKTQTSSRPIGRDLCFEHDSINKFKENKDLPSQRIGIRNDTLSAFLKTTLLVICSCFILAACGGEKKDGMSNEVVSDNFADEAASAVGSVSGALNRMEELEKMTPTTEDGYRAWLPETVLGLPRIDKEAPLSKIEGLSMAYVTYRAGEKEVTFRVHDHAGEASSTFMVTKNFVGKEQFNQERDNGYDKAVNKKGYVANETYDSGLKNRTNLIFIQDNRYEIRINATGFSPYQVWGNLADFKLEELE